MCIFLYLKFRILLGLFFSFVCLESSFFRCLNSLYDPAVKSAMTPAYTAALDMHDLDTSAIYGMKSRTSRSSL